jgi:2-polyprenyl-3-methyl-5-hydroxy-6-metoxy-1,4-benzoquinol methylase
MDASKLETELAFDGIYSNKVLHHLNNEELKNSVKRQSEILNPKGIICHSFWKGEGSEIFKLGDLPAFFLIMTIAFIVGSVVSIVLWRRAKKKGLFRRTEPRIW